MDDDETGRSDLGALQASLSEAKEQLKNRHIEMMIRNLQIQVGELNSAIRSLAIAQLSHLRDDKEGAFKHVVESNGELKEASRYSDSLTVLLEEFSRRFNADHE